MPSLTDVYITVKADTSKFDADLRRQLHGVDLSKDGKRVGDGFAGGFSGAFSGMASRLAGVFAAVGVGRILKDTITEASDLGESVNAVNVVFGEAAQGVLALGENSAKSVGLSNAQFNGLAVQFSAFAKTVAGSGGDVTGVLSALTVRAADFASVMNLDVNEATTVFQSALAGETEPIRKFGIDLSAAAVEAYAMANGIGTAGKALTESEKVQARYALLMEKTANTTGDFANTSDSLANRQRVLKASFDDIQASLGTMLLPVLERVAGFLVDSVIPAVETFIAQMKSGEGAGGQFATILGVIKDEAVVAFDYFKAEVLPTLAEFGKALAAGDGEKLREMFASLGDSLVKLAPVFRELIAQMPELVSAAGLVVDALAFLASHSETLVRLLPFLAAGYLLVKTAQAAALAVAIANMPIRVAEIAAMIIQGRGNAALAFQMSVLTGVQQRSTIATLAGTIATQAKAVVTGIAAAATALYTGIMQRGLIMQQLSALATYGQSTAFGTLTLSQKVAVVATKAVAAAQWLWNAALTANPIGLVVVAIGALVGGLILAYTKVDWFRKGVDAALNWIKDAFQWLYDFLLGHSLIPDLINGIIGWFTKLGSMLRSVMSGVVGVLTSVWDGIAAAFGAAMSGLRATYNTVVAPVFSLFGGAARLLGEGVGAVWVGIRAGFAVAMGGFGGVYESLVVPVLGAFKAGAGALQVAAQVAWDGIKAGFGAAMSGFMAVYDNVIAPVFGAFKAAAQFLWDGVEIIWAGIKAGFGLAMTGLKAVYDNVIAPVFATFEAAAGLLWEGVKFFWEAIKIDFALAMAGISLVYDNVIKPLFAAFKDAAELLWDGVKVIWSAMETGFDLYMRGVRAVYDKVIVPLFDAFKVAAQFLWDGVEVIFEGIRTAFDLAMQGVRTVYDKVIVPLFDAFKTAAQILRDGVQVIWDGMRDGFDDAMRNMRSVYDNVVKPLFDTFATGVQGLKAVFGAAVDGISAVWDTLRDRMRAPIKIAFDWVNENVIDKMRGVISAITGGSVDLPSLPSLRDGGPVEGPGGPRDDKVLMWGSAGEYMVNAAAAKKHRGLLEDINAGRAATRLPGDETGGPVGDVWGTITGAADAIKGFAADMLTKGARKAAEFLLNPIKDQLFSLIGTGNVVSAVLRGGLEKLFAAVMAKGDEKDKEMAAAKKAGGGTGAFPGGGSQANLVAFGRLIQSMGGRASEHPLFGGVNAVHTSGSNHYVGKAIDLNYGPGGQNATEMAFFDRVLAQGLPRQYGLRSIWRAPGHFNHMHVDYDKGGWLMPGATGANRGTKPERVLTAAQTDAFDRLVKVLEKGQGDTRPPLVVHAYGAREEILARHVLEGLRRRDALYQMG